MDAKYFDPATFYSKEEKVFVFANFCGKKKVGILDGRQTYEHRKEVNLDVSVQYYNWECFTSEP